jgi:hypothetical protein
MKKSESLLWQRIKKLKLKGQIFRIESNTINGIADVYWLINGKSIWIELKSNDVKNLGLSKYQINWHLEHYQNKGTSFILRECLSQRTSKRFELWLVREPRTLVLDCWCDNLKEIFKKIQDARTTSQR